MATRLRRTALPNLHFHCSRASKLQIQSARIHQLWHTFCIIFSSKEIPVHQATRIRTIHPKSEMQSCLKIQVNSLSPLVKQVFLWGLQIYSINSPSELFSLTLAPRLPLLHWLLHCGFRSSDLQQVTMQRQRAVWCSSA